MTGTSPADVKGGAGASGPALHAVQLSRRRRIAATTSTTPPASTANPTDRAITRARPSRPVGGSGAMNVFVTAIVTLPDARVTVPDAPGCSSPSTVIVV